MSTFYTIENVNIGAIGGQVVIKSQNLVNVVCERPLNTIPIKFWGKRSIMVKQYFLLINFEKTLHTVPSCK